MMHGPSHISFVSSVSSVFRNAFSPFPFSRFAGFSLLELLAVLVIIGVIAGMATLAVGTAGTERMLEQEARRLAGLVRVSCEESVLQGSSLAVSFGLEGTSYGFLRRHGEQWLPRRGYDARPRSLPDGFRAEVRVEDRAVPLDDVQAGRPHLVCLPSGELVPFRVRLSAPGARSAWLVSGEWDGDLSVERHDETS